METKKKKAAVTVLGIFVTALFIWLVIVGCNLYKNRWHKINFNINSITVVRTEGDTPYDGIYNVTVKGTASAWFYDFNKYQFDLVPASSGGYYPTFYQKTDTLVVTNKDKTPFEFSFTTKENMDEDCVDTVSRFIYGAENITVNGARHLSGDSDLQGGGLVAVCRRKKAFGGKSVPWQYEAFCKFRRAPSFGYPGAAKRA